MAGFATATGLGFTTATGFGFGTGFGFSTFGAGAGCTAFGTGAGFGFGTGFGFSGFAFGVAVAVAVVDSYWGISDFNSDSSDCAELLTAAAALVSFTGAFAFDAAGLGDSPSSLASKSSTANSWLERPKEVPEVRYCNGAKAPTCDTCTTATRRATRLNIIVIS